jgi:hypothetical protein
MTSKIGFAAFAAGILLAAAALAEGDAGRSGYSDAGRSGYSYVRDVSGDVTVDSQWNGKVEVRRNMPISAGDEIVVSDAGRAEIGLADGNVLYVGGRTTARFDSLYAQQGGDDEFSAIKLQEGSVILAAVGSNQDQIPRIDTDEATVYLSAGSRVRVNVDPRRGTVVIARAGSVEVRTREGSSTLRAGQYAILQEGREAEIDRGSFSRDRLDLWAAERLESQYETRSASARYVEPEYQSDVVALDGYGDWSYNDTYGDVWSPRVSAGWSPYSYGSWYYTPLGLTWWSYDPWGWYPHHYGNWFFDVSWNRWCWTPASVYSPAWVYWGYTSSYVGWCPIGYYSFYSPWYQNYYRRWGWDRRGVYISIRGTFDPRHVDFRGWNFVGAGGFAAVRRMEVIPGARIADRLGSQVAISSRPIVVNPRGGDTREAIQRYVRQAPSVIQRTSTSDSRQLAPILARERTLPPATVQALRDRAVVAERGRLAGPAVADIAPRGALVERNRAPLAGGRPSAPMTIDRGRAGVETSRPTIDGRPAAPSREIAPRGRQTERPDARVIAPPPRSEDWRTRGRAEAAPPSREIVRPDRAERPQARPERAPAADWRSRPAPQPRAPEAAPAPRSEVPRADSWRSRSEMPPARRVIEGAVPGRRPEPAAPDRRGREVFRGDLPRRDARPDYAPPPRPERYAPAPRPERYAPAPRAERPASVAPAPRPERAPAYSAPRAPAPRAEHHAPPPAHGSPPDRSRNH